ncbi:unnamed protein product [Effrenium voratum]|uniref:Uncharacterized protein n=1 Tax=Effrenium voratum TaxID=2562239 RepID=A0AA36JPZ6_9DINO|nr:unnamed protein product [Effrenium voratum]CAJ1443411.1 unnamed protein product [Effrenium voratum]
MLRKLWGKDGDAFSSAEEAAVTKLASAHSRLVIESGRVNTKSEAGFNSCALFLEGLDSTSRAMHLEPAPRKYRTAFTINYRALFPDEARNYRVDVLEASVEQYAVIWVNGDKFEFSAEAMRRAEALQRCLADLAALLERWISEQARASRPSRSDMHNALVSLDASWASFEHKYIMELIEIEEKARRLVVQAIEREKSLHLMEDSNQDQALSSRPEYREELRRFVASIAHLNSVANVRRKGRDDLSMEVLLDAMQTLSRCDAEKGENSEKLATARILAKDVLDSFAAMREYLREVGRCLERVDPHLCNNAGLVARLVDWEESWEVGTRYVQQERMLSAVCDLVAEIRSAQRIAPALAQMCEECDVEMFMVIPRMAWLRCLDKPTLLEGFFKSLLPHRFGEPNGEMPEKKAELDAFTQQFADTKELLMAAMSPTQGGLLRTGDFERATWEMLVKRIVNGDNGKDTYQWISPSLREPAEKAVEDLMRNLEAWSMELARHCPEDWNQCCGILVQCLSGTEKESTKGPFRV